MNDKYNLITYLGGIFDGPDIRKMMKDPDFIKSMTPTEADAWKGFVNVVQKFLGNRRAENYRELVKNMLDAYQRLGANMSIKLHYLHNHLDQFPANCGDVSDEQGERFHQDIKDMEIRYQGKWSARMMADYCWSIARSNPSLNHSRQAHKNHFLPQLSSSFAEK